MNEKMYSLCWLEQQNQSFLVITNQFLQLFDIRSTQRPICCSPHYCEENPPYLIEYINNAANDCIDIQSIMDNLNFYESNFNFKNNNQEFVLFYSPEKYGQANICQIPKQDSLNSQINKSELESFNRLTNGQKWENLKTVSSEFQCKGLFTSNLLSEQVSTTGMQSVFINDYLFVFQTDILNGISYQMLTQKQLSEDQQQEQGFSSQKMKYENYQDYQILLPTTIINSVTIENIDATFQNILQLQNSKIYNKNSKDNNNAENTQNQFNQQNNSIIQEDDAPEQNKLQILNRYDEQQYQIWLDNLDPRELEIELQLIQVQDQDKHEDHQKNLNNDDDIDKQNQEGVDMRFLIKELGQLKDANKKTLKIQEEKNNQNIEDYILGSFQNIDLSQNVVNPSETKYQLENLIFQQDFTSLNQESQQQQSHLLTLDDKNFMINKNIINQLENQWDADNK